MAKYSEKTARKYKTCGEVKEKCPAGMGGWCTSRMYAYPGNAAVTDKPENCIDVCTMSRK